MCYKGSVGGHQSQILDQALREKKPVERIASGGLGLHVHQNVVTNYRNELYPCSFNRLCEQRAGHPDSESPQPRFNGDLP